MVTVSLCMIAKNESDVMARCLLSVKDAVDEIIVVDTGSSDNTPQIAYETGAQVFFFPWCDDFSAARNFAFSKATKDYILWLDADDIFTPDDLSKFLAVKKRLDGKIRQVVAKYHVAFDEDGNVTLSYYRERLFLRCANFCWKGEIHETIPIENSALYADFAVTHAKLHPTESGRNLRIFEKLISDGKILDDRQQYYYARELYYNNRLAEAVPAFEKFLTGNGWIEDKIGACILLARCHTAMKNETAAFSALFMSFTFDRPRAEVCCTVADLFLEKSQYKTAAFWYRTALTDAANAESGALINCDFYGYIPLLQLCVCYDRLGDRKKASEYNEMAAKYKPNSKAIKYNRDYFKSVTEKEPV